jgi:uncharacterized protein with von Willebrand factor type A (vWA) domain
MPAEHTATTFEVDLAALAVAVGQRLHEADMQVTPEQSERYACSLGLTKPRSREALYHTTRAIFVTDFEQVETFDRVFAGIFGAGSAAAVKPVVASAQA